jgi:protein arginine kinase
VNLHEGLGQWLAGEGPDSSIALCTRVRFARNVQGYRFSPQMTAPEARELQAFVEERIGGTRLGPDLRHIHLDEIDRLDRQVLIERHLISRELANAERRRSVAVDHDESVSIMVNEEDHLRVQVFRSGNRVDETYAAAEGVDDRLLAAVPIAFSEEFGFLTSCPTNAGTGLRISVMLHLPALVWADEIEKAANTAQKIHLAVRGLYGEGSRALGDFYQVSNQVTLGATERQIAADVKAAVDRLITWEREVRAALLRGESRARTLDRVHRAHGVLTHARILSSEECLNCLSAVRFGVDQELLDAVDPRHLNRILLQTPPGHLQRRAGAALDRAERDQRRANLVREILSST